MRCQGWGITKDVLHILNRKLNHFYRLVLLLEHPSQPQNLFVPRLRYANFSCSNCIRCDNNTTLQIYPPTILQVLPCPSICLSESWNVSHPLQPVSHYQAIQSKMRSLYSSYHLSIQICVKAIGGIQVKKSTLGLFERSPRGRKKLFTDRQYYILEF